MNAPATIIKPILYQLGQFKGQNVIACLDEIQNRAATYKELVEIVR